MRSGSVMAPTMTRMSYLTLRGISVGRLLKSIPEVPPRIVEVHPGAALPLRGAPVDAVKAFKKDKDSRGQHLQWLAQQGVDAAANESASDHYVAACAAALAT